jgi:hypothetical protein
MLQDAQFLGVLAELRKAVIIIVCVAFHPHETILISRDGVP